jgi:hypothetical protein
MGGGIFSRTRTPAKILPQKTLTLFLVSLGSAKCTRPVLYSFYTNGEITDA